MPKIIVKRDVPIRSVKVLPKDAHPENKDVPKMAFGECARWDEFKENIRRNGVLTPVFCTPDMVCVTGHYRLWAAEAVGLKTVDVAIVESAEAALEYF